MELTLSQITLIELRITMRMENRMMKREIRMEDGNEDDNEYGDINEENHKNEANVSYQQ